MPAVSKAQARFMGAVAGGAIHRPGLTPAKAKEFLRGVDVTHLPPRLTENAHATKMPIKKMGKKRYA